MQEETSVYVLYLPVNLPQKFVSDMLLGTTHFINLLHVKLLSSLLATQHYGDRQALLGILDRMMVALNCSYY